jgi:hypothetical protein
MSHIRLSNDQIENGPTKDGFIHVHGEGSDEEGGMKTICALVFVASVLYILLILLKFT